MSAIGGLAKVELTKPLLLSTAAARQQYTQHLEDNKRKVKAAATSLKRKSVLEDIEGTRKKKKRL